MKISKRIYKYKVNEIKPSTYSNLCHDFSSQTRKLEIDLYLKETDPIVFNG